MRRCASFAALTLCACTAPEVGLLQCDGSASCADGEGTAAGERGPAGQASPVAGALPAIAAEARCLPVPVGTADQPLIDDFEDGDETRAPVFAHSSSQFFFTDPASSAEWRVVRGGAPGSSLAIRFQGGHSADYAGYGFAFNTLADGTACPFDATNYAGVAFWARSENGAMEMGVQLGLSGDSTCYLVEPGWECLYYDSSSIRIDATWSYHEIRWDEFNGLSDAPQVLSPINPTVRNLYELQFQPLAFGDFSFDLDDVAFLTGCGNSCDPLSSCIAACCGNASCEPFERSRFPPSQGSHNLGPAYCAEDCAGIPPRP